MSARECGCRRRAKDSSGLRSGPWEIPPDCPRCNGTGKVWPSVEGEKVAILGPPDGTNVEAEDAIDTLLDLIGGFTTPVRIIAQPIDGKEG